MLYYFLKSSTLNLFLILFRYLIKAIFLQLSDTYTYNTIMVTVQLNEFSPVKLNTYMDSDKQNSTHHLYVEK